MQMARSVATWRMRLNRHRAGLNLEGLKVHMAGLVYPCSKYQSSTASKNNPPTHPVQILFFHFIVHHTTASLLDAEESSWFPSCILEPSRLPAFHTPTST